MAVFKRQAVALLIVFECLLILIAFAGFATQTNIEQDRPIAFEAVLAVMLGVGNVLGLVIALVAYAAIQWSKHRRHSAVE